MTNANSNSPTVESQPRPRYYPSVSTVIAEFLGRKGVRGATLDDVYREVQRTLGVNVPLASIRSRIYQQLPGAKGGQRARFRRVTLNGEIRYKLL